VSYGEPIILRGQVDLEQVASSAIADARPQADGQFIERLKRGDAAAFETLVNERSGEIYGLLYRRIAINQARNRWRWWRRRRRDATVSLDAPEIGGGRLGLISTLKSNTVKDPEQDTLANERERALKKALSSLRRVYREAVVLRDIEGFAYEEIAATLQISVGTVKSRLARGRQELRRKLEGSL
jgi:RNA polymerase sigma-70 factor (ECF subfamily)